MKEEREEGKARRSEKLKDAGRKKMEKEKEEREQNVKNGIKGEKDMRK